MKNVQARADASTKMDEISPHSLDAVSEILFFLVG